MMTTTDHRPAAANWMSEAMQREAQMRLARPPVVVLFDSPEAFDKAQRAWDEQHGGAR